MRNRLLLGTPVWVAAFVVGMIACATAGDGANPSDDGVSPGTTTPSTNSGSSSGSSSGSTSSSGASVNVGTSEAIDSGSQGAQADDDGAAATGSDDASDGAADDADDDAESGSASSSSSGSSSGGSSSGSSSGGSSSSSSSGGSICILGIICLPTIGGGSSSGVDASRPGHRDGGLL